MSCGMYLPIFSLQIKKITGCSGRIILLLQFRHSGIIKNRGSMKKLKSRHSEKSGVKKCIP